MNGTSFAAVTTDSGDRQIFFQDKSGAVRFMQYSYEKQGWSQAKATPIKASNHTPMSAFTYTLRNTTIVRTRLLLPV